jgi:hypothetical protein
LCFGKCGLFIAALRSQMLELQKSDKVEDKVDLRNISEKDVEYPKKCQSTEIKEPAS